MITVQIPPTQNIAEANRVGTVGAIFLCLLVFSGQMKETVIFSWLPVDLTSLTAGITAVSLIRSRIKHGAASSWIWLVAVLWIVFTFPLLHTDMTPAAADKVTLLFTVTLLIAAAPFYLLRTHHQRRAFLWTTAAIGVVATLLVVVTGTTVEGYTSRYIIEGADSIGTARVAGAGALVYLLYSVTRGRRIGTRLTFAASGVVMLVVAVASGSRGPVLATAGALVIAVLASRELKKYRLRVVATLLLGGIAVLWIARKQSAEGLDRVLNFVSGESDASTQARDFLAEQAWYMINTNPFGFGWGGYNIDEIYSYPHNTFLEVPAEAGWVAGVIFFLVTAFSGFRYLFTQRTPEDMIFLALFVFAVLNAAVSSNLPGNRLLVIMMFAAWSITLTKTTPRSDAVASRP